MTQVNIFNGLQEMGFQEVKGLQLFPDIEQEKEAVRLVKQMKPEDYLFSKSVNCPCCGVEFKSPTVKKGKLKLESSDSDLKPVYEGFEPVLYDVIVCPTCGYAALHKYFTTLLNNQRKWIQEQISVKFKPREYPLELSPEMAIERYKLALLNAVIKKAKDSEKAMLCLKLAWVYRGLKNEEEEKSCLENAITGFERAYENEAFPIAELDEHTVSYLIGELYRRVGNNPEALKWLGRVIVARGINKRLKERAIDQKEEIRRSMNR